MPSAAAPAPQAAMPPSTGGAKEITGPVLETMDASNYTYVRVSAASGDVWAASSHFDVKVGDRVVVPLEMPMQNFHSQSLNRDFPLIYFASFIRREGEPVPARASGQTPMSSHGAPVPKAEVTEPIAPPAGGSRIADVWANRKTLAGKSVTVRGKVVKFNGGIMDRNWIHIQDGSGKVEDKTNDLTITTSDTAKVGDVITVTGTVAIDKDFTAGYAYPVIIENAKIAK
jgi:hypothetical protein